ncbi:hypothetical protein SDC9_157387 [bioreactor metagenome]|uniref:Uncharacterized protein n=1 Tax=bioreactor metagenome TaxID=1076179 RepID=A0A645FC05_9ZZZZ
MDDVIVVKAAHHMHDGGCLADVGQKFIAQPLPLGGALHQPRDVHKLHHGGGGLLGGVHPGQLVQPVIGHGHHAHIGLNGAEGVVGALRAGVGYSVEQGALAHVGQPHDSQFHRLLLPSFGVFHAVYHVLYRNPAKNTRSGRQRAVPIFIPGGRRMKAPSFDGNPPQRKNHDLFLPFRKAL